MATEVHSYLPATLEDHRQHAARPLQRLFVATMAVALAMIVLLIGLGLTTATSLEATPDRPVAISNSR